MNLKKFLNLLLLVFLIISCTDKTKRQIYKKNSINEKYIQKSDFQKSINAIKLVNFPLDKLDYIKCIVYDGTYYEIDSLCQTENKDILKYVNNTVSGTRKENIFYLASEKKYFPAFRYKANDRISIIGFLTEYWLEDTKGVFLQLNTFDNLGNQIDYLIIINRFSNEGIYYQTDFEILDKLQEIKLTNYIKDANINLKDSISFDKNTHYFFINDKGIFVEKN